MAFTQQANKKTTISGDFNAGATSLTLATAAFSDFTDGYLVVDYDNDSKFEIIKCTVTGTSVTSITRGQDGTSDLSHTSGAKIGFAFVPSHYANGLGIIAAGDAYVTTWSPSYTPSGSLTYSSVTNSYKHHRQIGRRVEFAIRSAGTLGGSASNTIDLNLPITSAASLDDWPFECTLDISGASGLEKGIAFWKNTTTLSIRRAGSANYPTSGSLNIYLNGWYIAPSAAGV